MKTVHVFSRATPLTDVKGRVNYATNPDKQEHLLAVAGQTDPAFWVQLGKESQLAYKTAGGDKSRACCEAREIFGTYPNSAENEDLQALAQEQADAFSAKYGVPCLIAIHKNKKESSLHYHMIFSDRPLLPEPVIRVADRNVFLDETGVRKRTKKEILNEDGQIREGCRIVSKGEVLSERRFGAKDESFAGKEWMNDYNHHMADWINDRLQPDKLRTVYDPNGPYLPQVRIPKGTPAEKEVKIQKYNRIVQKYNNLVEAGAVLPEEALAIKGQVMLAPNRYEALEDAVFLQRAVDAEPGGKRTKNEATDPMEQKRQQLRQLYKKSRVAWAEYRKMENGSLDKKKALAEARGISAEIDRLKREMGLYSYEEYKDIMEKEARNRDRAREWAKRCLSQAYGYDRKREWCKRRINELYGELVWVPIFFMTDEDRAAQAAILAQIAELEEAKKRYEKEEAEAYLRYCQAKKDERKQRKELRETRREARQQRKKEKTQEHDRGR